MSDDLKPFFAIGILLGVLLIGDVMWSWYKAGVTAEVYRREGIQVSQWEAFIGTLPPARAIRLEGTPNDLH